MTDFWGVAFPAYLGGIAGIASAAIALIAFLRSIKNKEDVQSIRVVLEPEKSVKTTLGAESRASDTVTALHRWLQSKLPPTEWELKRERREGGRRYDFVATNTTDRILTLTGIELFDGRSWHPADLPAQRIVEPGGEVFFDIARRVFGADLTVLGLQWVEPDGTLRSGRILS